MFQQRHLRTLEQKMPKLCSSFIHTVVEAIFARISSPTKSKEAWDALKNGYQGNTKVVTVKLQTLHWEFETSFIKDIETLHDYFCNLTEVVNQIQKFGVTLIDEKNCPRNLIMWWQQLKNLKI